MRRQHMTVFGDHTVSVKPDTAIIRLGVQTQNQQVRTAQEENNRITAQIIQALTSIGVPKEAIQTAVYTITPMYDYVEGKQEFRGYEVTHILEITAPSVDQAGVITDTAVQNGANRINGIDFSVRDENAVYQQALNEALRQAQRKAKELAASLHLQFDPVPFEIIERKAASPVAFKTFAASAAPTPIEPGLLEISASVETVFFYE